MLILRYDHTFAGFLSAVFELYAGYDYKKCPDTEVSIVKQDNFQPDLFGDPVDVPTDEARAERVLKGLEKHLGKSGVKDIIWGFLSEHPDMEACLLGVISYAVRCPRQAILSNYAHPQVMALANLVKSVGRERHRMLAFVRFEKMHNDIFFARIAPDFNVLPLIGPHFQQRYQDQAWAIYDLRRGYGIYYDLQTVQVFTEIDPVALHDPAQLFSDAERAYQKLWQRYFKNATITERKNTKLHIQQLPVRYWQYLTEKKLY